MNVFRFTIVVGLWLSAIAAAAPPGFGSPPSPGRAAATHASPTLFRNSQAYTPGLARSNRGYRGAGQLGTSAGFRAPAMTPAVGSPPRLPRR